MFWNDLGKGVSIREDNRKGEAEREVKILFQNDQTQTAFLNLNEIQAKRLVDWLRHWLNHE